MTNLLGASEVRELANKLDLKPTKKLGQNFVVAVSYTHLRAHET